MIIGAGLTKSGCVTLRKALATLGLQAKNMPTKEELLSGKCDAYTGIPCLAYLDEIIAKYPDAKVIYCELNQEDWLKACTEHFGKTENPYYLQLRKLVYGVQTPKKTHLEKAYQEYKKKVGELENVLVINWSEKPSWKTLCDYLGVKTPDADFPAFIG